MNRPTTRGTTPDWITITTAIATNTPGTIQCPNRRSSATTVRCEPSHDPARHHTATRTTNTDTVTTLSSRPVVRNNGVYTEMLSAPLAMVTPATGNSPAPPALPTGSAAAGYARTAPTRPRTPNAMGTSPSRPTHRSGTIVRPSAATAETTTSTAMPAYCPTQICHTRGAPTARDDRNNTVNTIRSSTLV